MCDVDCVHGMDDANLGFDGETVEDMKERLKRQ